MTLRLAFNILAVCGAASFAGAMLLIGLAFGAYWKSLPPASFLEWFGANGHLIGAAIPVFVIPALIGFAGSIAIDWSIPPARGWWFAALACLVGVGAITAAYHLPANATFASGGLPADQAPAMLDRWLLLHNVRIALGLLAAALAMVAASR